MTQGTLKREGMVAQYSEHDWYLCFQGKKYVLDNQAQEVSLISQHHNTAQDGHPGQAEMFYIFSRWYYCKDTYAYVKPQTNEMVYGCPRVRVSIDGE